MERKLTEKQQRFADYYIEIGNATEAYVKAGYCKKGANASASRLLANVSIQNYIDKRLEESKSKRIADSTEVLEYFTSVMRGDIKGHALADGIPIKVPPTVNERTRAAEQLHKRYDIKAEKTKAETDILRIKVDELKNAIENNDTAKAMQLLKLFEQNSGISNDE